MTDEKWAFEHFRCMDTMYPPEWPGGVCEAVRAKLGAGVVTMGEDVVMGESVHFVFGKYTVQTWIKEETDRIILFSIGAKMTDDLTLQARGTGLGTRVICALRDYADETGKMFVVPDTTAPAFWERFNWLKHDAVAIDWDGTEYWPPNTFTYRGST